MPTSGVCEKLECRFKLLSQLPGEFLVLIFVSQNQKMEHHFMQHGSYCGALGAFIQGKNKNSLHISKCNK